MKDGPRSVPGTDGRARSEVYDRPNLLITSASRKLLLVRAFRAALAELGGGSVIASDLDPRAAALYEADRRRALPRSDDPGYVDALRTLCREERVGLVIPTRDEELPILAAARDALAEDGTLVLVSSPAAVETCRDKRSFAAAVAAAGLDAPRLYDDPATAPLPVFVKPRIGKGGRAATTAATPVELAAAMAAAGPYALIQELIQAPEYTIDLFLDLDSQPISCVPRERMIVVGGESVVSRTVDDSDLAAASIRLATSIGLVGHVTIQAFRSPDRIAFIEINPRYGGAANLGFAAGALTPQDAIRLARGEELKPRLGEHEVGLVMLRASEDRFVHEVDLHFDEAPR
jgi:carbamoyl-phosphate synthase large subunit